MGSHLWAFQKWCGTEPADIDYELASEFIRECYAELVYEAGQSHEQLAHFIAALRAGKKLLPRDGWLGGAFPDEGCAVCGRSLAELIANGHDMAAEFEEGHKAEHKRRCQVEMAPSKNTRLPMHFGEALVALKGGYRVCRTEWLAPRGIPFTSYAQHISRTKGDTWLVLQEQHILISVGGTPVLSHRRLPWVATEADLLAEDWEIAPGSSCDRPTQP